MGNGCPRYPEVLYGEEICRRLKDLYAANIPWSASLSDKISEHFAVLMQKSLPFFPETSLLDVLRQLSQSANFKEICEDCELTLITEDVLHGTNKTDLATKKQKIQAKIFGYT